MASLAQDIAGGLVKFVLSRIKEEYDRLMQLAHNIKQLHEELEILYLLLEKITNSNKLMVRWFNDIKEAVSKADHLLDEWSYDLIKNGPEVEESGIEGMAKVGATAFGNVIKDAITLGSNDRTDKAAQVTDIITLIENIKANASRYGINIAEVIGGKDYGGERSKEMQEQELEDLKNLRERVDYRLLLGRHQDQAKLLTTIHDCNSMSRRLTVVGITGTAGVGKTALSKHIANVMKEEQIGNDSCEDKSVTAECSAPKKSFHYVFWVFVSHRYDLFDILKQVAEHLPIDNSIKKESKLMSELKQNLEGKRILLILDDVWNTLKWGKLEQALREISGSKVESKVVVLMTTRLPPQEVFDDLITLENEKYVDACVYVHTLEVLKKGDSWSLFKAKLGDKPRDELEARSEKEKMAQEMLKRCGGVPLAVRALADLLRGKHEEQWKAIRDSKIWENMGEDSILPSLRLSYIYLPTERLRKCFSYCANFKEGEVINKDKLIYMWTAQGFLWKVDDKRGVDDKGESYDDMELIGEGFVKCLLNRSLFHEPKLDKFGNIISFKMHDLVCALAKDVSEEQRKDIRISNIKDKWSSGLNQEKQLENFKRIRYLELRVDRSNAAHTVLPGHVTELYHLQTLWINSGFNLESKKKPCVIFPDKFDNLVKLRHIRNDSSSIAIPEGLGHLTALCTLPTVNLAFDWGGSPKEIGSLKNLRGKLEFRKLTCLKDEAEASSLNLEDKSKLDNLILHWTELGYGVENPKADEILQALRPNKELKKLEIRQYDGTKFPSWLTGEVAVLPNLVSLEIHFGKAEGAVELGNFKFLRFLTLNHCPGLIIRFPINGIGCCKVLEEVMIENCQKVTTSERGSNMSPFIQLRSLHIWDNVAKNEVALAGLSSLPRLSNLCIDELVNLADLNETSPVCSSLKTLKLKKSYSTATLPNQLQHLVALQCMNIVGFESLNPLPEWLSRLTSLRLLQLESLPKLDHLPSSDVMQSLSNLHTLNIEDCPLLGEKYIEGWLAITGRRRITLDDIPVYY